MTIKAKTHKGTENSVELARSTKPLDMLESLLSVTEQFTTQFDGPAKKEWYRISAATADLRETDEPVIDATERGNILLAHDEEFYLNAWIRWIRLPVSQWLQISYRNDNYPSLEVSTISIADESLAAHINKNFGGGLWSVRKLSIDGVNVKHNHVVGDDELKEYLT